MEIYDYLSMDGATRPKTVLIISDYRHKGIRPTVIN